MTGNGNLKTAVLYQVFVRNFSKEGTIEAVTKKLDYIASLGADILYLMPIQPIGEEGRKGTYGSPYAIKDYRAIDPALGTKEDVRTLCDKAHGLGIRVILDVVYNHTAKDSVLSKTHPEWFYKDSEGHFANKVGAWSDVIDLDHDAVGLDEELVDTLKMYVGLGIDGFRFDVASFIHPAFYEKARAALGKDVLFLAECVDTPFLLYARSVGQRAYSNGELAKAGVDLFYHYGSWGLLRRYLAEGDKADLVAYMAACDLEEASLPAGKYVVRAIENHDQNRLRSYGKGDFLARNLMAYSFFTMGPAFCYAGEEVGLKKKPDLFEKDPIDLTVTDPSYLDFFLRLVDYKHDAHNEKCRTTLFDRPCGRVAVLENIYDDGKEYGVFVFADKPKKLKAGVLEKGTYTDLLTGEEVRVSEKEDFLVERPLILRKA